MIGHHVVAVRRRDHNLATLHIYAKYGNGQPFGRLALLGGPGVRIGMEDFERPSAPSVGLQAGARTAWAAMRSDDGEA